jgi:hypothetical protein
MVILCDWPWKGNQVTLKHGTSIRKYLFQMETETAGEEQRCSVRFHMFRNGKRIRKFPVMRRTETKNKNFSFWHMDTSTQN